MQAICHHKEFFALGLFVMAIIYFWIEVVWKMMKKTKKKRMTALP